MRTNNAFIHTYNLEKISISINIYIYKPIITVLLKCPYIYIYQIFLLK